MLRKMMKHLVNNPWLKVLSVLLSVVLWMVVVKMADPDFTKPFSVPVEILNKDVIRAMGKVPDIVGDTDIAVFYISGPRSYVEDMTGDDFSVTADLSQVDLTQDGERKLIPIEISAKKNDKKIEIVKKTVNMQITLEDLSEQKFVISPEATGTPGDGCAIGDVEVIPNLLQVSGPESIVSQINRVSASINVDGVSGDVSDNVKPTLYDENGDMISSDLLEMNQNVVTIRAKILSTKSIPIRCQVSGAPADGYEYKGVEYAPEEVLVKGEASLLNSISAINIPEGVVNIEGEKEDKEVVVDITPYLGESGVSLVDEATNQILVRVLIEKKETKMFSFPVERIQVTGLDPDFELTFSGNSAQISVRASREEIGTLQTGDINAALDVSGLEPGTHTLQLNVVLPSDKFEVVDTVNVQVTITDKNAQPEVEDDEGQEGVNRPDGGGASGDTMVDRDENDAGQDREE